MHRRPLGYTVFTVFLLFVSSSARFRAQPAQPNHTLTFAELTYGTGTTAMAADGYVMKLNPAGDRVLYSTYIGGRDDDDISAIAVGANGIHLTGTTISSDFPVTAGALQAAFAFGTDPNGDSLNDAFYTRLAAN